MIGLHAGVRLGKMAPRYDPRTLLMASYVKHEFIPPPPDKRYWSAKAASDWGMMKNDVLGDCTCAAIGHLIQAWTANSTTEVTISDDDVVRLYEEFCGYKPGDPGTDEGGVELDVLNGFVKQGAAGHKIDGYVALEPHNHDHVRASIDLFGGIYTGVALPLSAQDQKVWSVVRHAPNATPGSWGGHAIAIVDYDKSGLACVTWGALKRMTWQWFDMYCDEAYAILSQDWANAGRMAPSGFDYAALTADLASLRHAG
jgi:hypothetical protein